MAMRQALIPKMAQQLRMTPQLQQAIKLLQLSRMELIDVVRQEMAENPLLEDAQDVATVGSASALESVNQQEAREQSDRVSEVKADGHDAAVDQFDWESFADNFSAPLPANSYKGLGGDELPGVEQTLSTSESLVEHLLEQLRLSNMGDQQQMLTLLMIGNLDERGYLTGMTLEEIAEEASASMDDAEYVLERLQWEFDPVGIGARDLRECLLIQLERLHPEEELARKLVEEHIPSLERKSYGKLARQLGVEVEDILDAARLISNLEPHPGREYEVNETRYVTPDIYIRKDGARYVAMLNEDGLPKLRISRYYRQELQRKRVNGERDEAKEYIQDKLRGAVWLIRSIHNRQSTIVKVTESIIKFQHDFFERGVEHLRPLVLRDVAQDIDMHESTVSRVTTNKYVHTPRGIFELKFFFNSSITKHDGDDLASQAVKAKIREIVGDEDESDVQLLLQQSRLGRAYALQVLYFSVEEIVVLHDRLRLNLGRYFNYL